MPLDVVTVGDSVVDIVIPVPRFPAGNEDSVVGEGMTRQLGGASNFLIQASRLALAAGIVDCVGDDDLGVFLVEGLRSEGVDVSRICVKEGVKTASCICMVDETGDHAYIGFPGATEHLTPERIEPEHIHASRLLYVSGYALATPPLRDAVLKSVEIATGAGIPIFFDPSPVITRVDEKVREQVIGASKLISLNVRELELLTAISDVEEASGALRDDGVEIVVLKLGGEGCAVSSASGFENIPGFHVRAVDTTGAGDAFNAALVYGHLVGWPVEKAARFANIVGAVKVTKMGAGVNVPTKAEIDRFLTEHKVETDFSI
ncbi:carbohydrate kinase family protein [Candidatus Bathyarchaeota archaeon]|nr:carbohydrate kinase family protein [Candidatus Bathyarchaeota archaeon]